MMERPQPPAGRYPELDLLRTVAILGMVAYHTAFDLRFLHHWPIAVNTGAWKLLQRLVCSLFLLLVGAGLAISWQRSTYPRFLRRGLRLLSLGLVITAFTVVFDSRTFVRFGILHAIGVSVLLVPLLAPLKELNALLGLAVLVLARFLPQHADTTLLLPLGVTPPGFRSLDYCPLVPWLGPVLIGHALGHSLYVRWTAWRRLLPGTAGPTVRALGLLGRHSLLIYMLHQPILVGLLAAFHGRLALAS